MGELPISIVDIAILGILLISGVLAFSRGFVREVLSIGSWVAAAFATIYGFPLLQPVLRQHISLSWMADAITAVSIFLVTLVLCAALSGLVARNVKGSAFGAVDRSLGLAFGLLRGAVLVCVAYLVLGWLTQEEKPPGWLAEARSLPLLTAGAELIQTLLPGTAVEQGSAAAADAARTGERMLELERAVRGLNEGGGAAAEEAAPEGESGYRSEERKDLERLIQGTQ